MKLKRCQIIILQDCLRPGGTERHSLWLAEILQDDLCSAQLLLFQPPKTTSRPSLQKLVALQQRRTPFSWFAPGLIRTLREREAALVICMGRNANSHAVWIRTRLPEMRVITTCRTSRRLPLLYRYGIGRSHHCLTNSNWAARQLAERGIKETSHITTIPNALLRPGLLDLDRSPTAIAAARERLGLPRDGQVLCNIASFVPGKNKQALLRTFARRPKPEAATLLLVGEGAELAACRKLAARLGLGNSVRFLNHTETVDSILQASDLFVSTALRDSLPNALIEAQAAGVPVVAWETGGSSETFVDGESGISVPPGDETGLANAIDSLLTSPETRRRFGETARAHCRERFHPDRIATLYRATVQEWIQAQ